MKKIVVLTGSPRAGGNSEQMADIFISESQAKGHDVVKIRCAELDLLGCRACDCCYKDDKPCLMEKNFNTIAPVIQEAAVVVVFSPPVSPYKISVSCLHLPVGVYTRYTVLRLAVPRTTPRP